MIEGAYRGLQLALCLEIPWLNYDWSVQPFEIELSDSKEGKQNDYDNPSIAQNILESREFGFSHFWTHYIKKMNTSD